MHCWLGGGQYGQFCGGGGLQNGDPNCWTDLYLLDGAQSPVGLLDLGLQLLEEDEGVWGVGVVLL